MAGMFNYETQLADLSNRYAQKSATDDYARLLGQQRFSRQKQDTTQGWMQAFPKFTGQWAGRLGNQVQSGVFRQDLTDSVNNFNQQLGRQDQDQATAEGQYQATQTMDAAGYQKALMAIQEQLLRERASADPYASLSGVK